MMNEIFEFEIINHNYQLCSQKKAEDKLSEILEQRVQHEVSWVRITDVDETYINLVRLPKAAYLIIRMYKPKKKAKKSILHRLLRFIKGHCRK